MWTEPRNLAETRAGRESNYFLRSRSAGVVKQKLLGHELYFRARDLEAQPVRERTVKYRCMKRLDVDER